LRDPNLTEGFAFAKTTELYGNFAEFLRHSIYISHFIPELVCFKVSNPKPDFKAFA
jgi:hypothetical protein